MPACHLEGKKSVGCAPYQNALKHAAPGSNYNAPKFPAQVGRLMEITIPTAYTSPHAGKKYMDPAHIINTPLLQGILPARIST